MYQYFNNILHNYVTTCIFRPKTKQKANAQLNTFPFFQKIDVKIFIYDKTASSIKNLNHSIVMFTIADAIIKCQTVSSITCPLTNRTTLYLHYLNPPKKNTCKNHSE
jgi:hypothetical protein